MKLTERIRTSPKVVYLNHYAGEGGQWFKDRHGTKYVRAYDFEGLREALMNIVDSWDARSELYKSDFECAQNMADRAHAALVKYAK